MLCAPEELRDPHRYEEYTSDSDEDHERPLLIEKTSRLIAAVVQNEVDDLCDLLDEPKWYGVSDVSGYSLLHIAILCQNVEVFDCMMTIPDFPLEFVDRFNETPLTLALHGSVDIGDDMPTNEHFACELIKKSPNIPRNCCPRSTPLHCCLLRSYFRASELLMERGVDVNMPNSRGYTPLEFSVYNDNLETALALLMYGAEPSITLFENSVLQSKSEILAETLCFLLFDEYSTFELQLDVLVKLAEQRNPLLYELIAFSVPISFIPERGYSYFCQLCSVDSVYLRLIVTNYSHYVSEAFISVNLRLNYMICDKPIFLKNLPILLESDLESATMFLVSHMNRFVTFRYFENIANSQQTDVEELYLFLVSYGLHVTVTDLEFVYRLPPRRYSKFFKVLLHMDIHPHILYYNRVIDAMPAFIYNVNMDLETFFQHPESYIYSKDLFHYFRHPRLIEIYNAHHNLRPTEEQQSVPQIPRLLELARNTFRRFFISSFSITSSRSFYTHLRQLAISNEYKKIISYEIPLY